MSPAPPKLFVYRCRKCGGVARQGVDKHGGEGALHCPKHPREVVDTILVPARAPKGSLGVQMPLRLSPELAARLRKAAAREGLSANEWVRRAIEAILPA